MSDLEYILGLIQFTGNLALIWGELAAIFLPPCLVLHSYITQDHFKDFKSALKYHFEGAIKVDLIDILIKVPYHSYRGNLEELEKIDKKYEWMDKYFSNEYLAKLKTNN